MCRNGVEQWGWRRVRAWLLKRHGEGGEQVTRLHMIACAGTDISGRLVKVQPNFLLCKGYTIMYTQKIYQRFLERKEQ